MDRRVRSLLLGAGLVAVVLILLVRSRDAPSPDLDPAADPIAELEKPPRRITSPEYSSPIPPTVDPPVPFVSGAGPHRIESGQTIGIESDALPTEGDLILDLRLPADVISAEPPVRVISPDGRLIETIGEVGAEPGNVRLPLDPGWLRPGRYIIEVKTQERSHFPLRRYALEVR